MEPINLSECTINGFKTKQAKLPNGIATTQIVVTISTDASADVAAQLIRRIGGLVAVSVGPTIEPTDTIDMFDRDGIVKAVVVHPDEEEDDEEEDDEEEEEQDEDDEEEDEDEDEEEEEEGEEAPPAEVREAF